MSFSGPNQSNPGISDPRDLASLRPGQGPGPGPIPRDRRMDWKPDLVLDAQEWIQRAQLGDEDALKTVVLIVAPVLLAEVKTYRDKAGAFLDAP